MSSSLLSQDAEWRVVSVSRRTLDFAGSQAVQQVTSLDLTKREEVRPALKEAGLEGAETYGFHCAYLDTGSPTGRVSLAGSSDAGGGGACRGLQQLSTPSAVGLQKRARGLRGPGRPAF